MTDKVRRFYTTENEATLDCGNGPSYARLHLSCGDGAIAIIQTESCGFPADGFLTYRFEGKKRDYASFVNNGSGTGVQFNDPIKQTPTADSFVEKTLLNDRLLVEIKTYGSQRSILEFDISGLKEFSGDDFRACFPEVFSANNAFSGAKKSDFEKQGGPFTADGIEGEILNQLRCQTPPHPTSIFEKLRELGKISYTENVGFDGMSCFQIAGDLEVAGITFTSICGYEEDEAIHAQYPDLYYRGRGTSPGLRISFGTNVSESALIAWYKANLNPALIESGIDSMYTNLDTAFDVGCTEWIVD
jgi:hypothetical protein